MIILILIMSCFFGYGIYQLLCGHKNIPDLKTSKAVLFSVKKPNNNKLSDIYLIKVATLLSPFMKLDPVKRGKLESALLIADVPLTPEVYTMKAHLTGLCVGFLSIPVMVLHPLLGFLVIGLSFLMWVATYQKVFDFVKKRKLKIEGELPKFCISIAQSLENNRDVLKLLNGYRRVAGPNLASELDITIADMKTSNYESALLKFQNRIGSTMLSDIIRGLIGTLRGDDQQMYFHMLEFDMRQIEQNNLKKEAAKRPKQMQKYSMMMLFCILLIYVVVLSVEVVSSVGSFF